MNFKIILLTSALMGAFTLSMAATTDTTSTDTTASSTQGISKASLDAQIEKIKNATASERVTLMNAFKKQVMTMKPADRQAAIAKMQTKMKATSDTIAATGSQNAQDNQVQTQNMQTKHAEDMAQLQSMRQQQVASQAGRLMNNVNNIKQTLGH
jgi:histidyl-tRNA synthetase